MNEIFKKLPIGVTSLILALVFMYLLGIIGVNQIINDSIAKIIAPECVGSGNFGCIALAIPQFIVFVFLILLYAFVFEKIILRLRKK
jgi:uncharacterized BrkB/YihY/UPF0761 family membrane protein